MNLARHYRTLGLRRGASAREVKRAYRTLVRQYHPDINPDEAAIEQFLKINDAYTIVCESIRASERNRRSTKAAEAALEKVTVEDTVVGPAFHSEHHANANDNFDGAADGGLDSRLQDIRLTLERLGFKIFDTDDDIDPSVHYSKHQSAADLASGLPSDKEEMLKQRTYEQLKGLLKQQKFPRAIALIEGLAHRMPQDAEIVQWQAIVYQRWGRQLIDEGQTHKARIYLKKALRTDPKNRALWREVNRDFWQLASLGS